MRLKTIGYGWLSTNSVVRVYVLDTHDNGLAEYKVIAQILKTGYTIYVTDSKETADQHAEWVAERIWGDEL